MVLRAAVMVRYAGRANIGTTADEGRPVAGTETGNREMHRFKLQTVTDCRKVRQGVAKRAGGYGFYYRGQAKGWKWRPSVMRPRGLNWHYTVVMRPWTHGDPGIQAVE